MRITVKTMQDRNSKESRYQKKFEKSLKKVLMKRFKNLGNSADRINDAIACFEEFDPVLDWEYIPICGCSVWGFDDLNHNIAQNRLFERNGHLLYYTTLSRAKKETQIVDGYEMWLLEDMRIVFTYFVQMKTQYSNDLEAMTYRYALGRKIPDDMYLKLDRVLEEIDDKIYYTRRPPVGCVDVEC